MMEPYPVHKLPISRMGPWPTSLQVPSSLDQVGPTSVAGSPSCIFSNEGNDVHPPNRRSVAAKDVTPPQTWRAPA